LNGHPGFQLQAGHGVLLVAAIENTVGRQAVNHGLKFLSLIHSGDGPCE
jgi:hypothetical protein